ncbi:hypothetical protein, partial [Neisseria bacilliformis]|uniref:hypothetical protein n=1 Tax=Neisseria bacilliformis TaxID=267212 RepID=UPI003C74DAAC
RVCGAATHAVSDFGKIKIRWAAETACVALGRHTLPVGMIVCGNSLFIGFEAVFRLCKKYAACLTN